MRRIGPWTLAERLGGGGHGDVWRATRDRPAAPIALKVLRNSRGTSYDRFRHEVKVLRDLGALPGILPLVDAYVPEQPTANDPAWLAMPVAEPISAALKDAGLVDVVRAIAEVAATLAELAEGDIHHRDVKPGNLYRHDGHYVIGDFGLVEYPSKEPLTQAGRKLGPLGFHAPEMLTRPETADGGPADVWSLGATLYVLASGQVFPPPGTLRSDVDATRLSRVVAHQRAHVLDRLLERCTQLEPLQRPKMTEVAAELRAWLAGPPQSREAGDLTDFGVFFEPQAVRAKHDEEARARVLERIQELRTQLRNELEKLQRRTVEQTKLSPIQTVMESDKIFRQLLRHRLRGSVSWATDVFGLYVPTDGEGSLWFGTGVMGNVAGEVLIQGVVAVSDTRSLPSLGRSAPPHLVTIWTFDPRTVPLGSAVAEAAGVDAIDGIRDHLREGLLELRKLVEARASQRSGES